jgi:hypothetical protein
VSKTSIEILDDPKKRVKHKNVKNHGGDSSLLIPRLDRDTFQNLLKIFGLLKICMNLHVYSSQNLLKYWESASHHKNVKNLYDFACVFIPKFIKNI